MTKILALFAFAVLGNLPLIAAIIGHIRAHRIQAEDDYIAYVEAGFASWTMPTPPSLAVVPWPARQTPTDLAPAYEPVPWTDPHWALTELGYIVAAYRDYDELVATAT